MTRGVRRRSPTERGGIQASGWSGPRHQVALSSAPVFQVKDLYPLAANNSVEQFIRRMGPFVLIQRPPAPVLAAVANQLGQGRTLGAVHRSRLANEMLAMLVGFKFLQVANLPPLEHSATLLVGRLPECQILVEEPSVSKRHAVLRWDAEQRHCYLEDLDSTNGTFVNARQIHEEVLLSDGDSISFGDSPFLFMLSGTLHEHVLRCGYEPLL